MIRTLALVLVASLAVMPIANAASTKTAPSKTRQVDGLFAEWNSPASPGASVAVLQNGKIIYSHGYGMASLEYGVPNTPATIFHMASVSKQFTAFAILLLAQDGKLSLDDDIHKYLPEMHDFGTPLTIRELLHHTSGLRDQLNLLALAGWRLEDVITEQDILNLLWRQNDLNFPPGDQELYSNTGYTLIGLIVRRVSGMPLSAFAAQRIFQPLGMTHTHFQDEYGNVVKNRAYSYGKDSHGAYKDIALSYSTVGPSSLFTTVKDMAKWDENFYTGKVGGKQLIADIQLKGKLNSGKEISYADGLIIDKYRGLNTVWHSGSDAGYRTIIMRFPNQHFSVVVLANAAELDTYALATKIADIYLGKEFSLPPIPAKKSISFEESGTKIDPKLLSAYVGNYELSPSYVLGFANENGQMVVNVWGQKYPIYPASENVFFRKDMDAQMTFDKPSESGEVLGEVDTEGGRDIPAKRIRLGSLTSERIKLYEGEYYSDELRQIYSITYREGSFYLRYPRGELILMQISPNDFAADFPIGSLRFTDGANGGFSGFTISDGRVRNLRFDKVSIGPINAMPASIIKQN